jgi:beta-N-acetylhexosaminidase
MISGLEAGGVTACIKYFPGLGSVTVDPAKERAVSDRSETEYRSGEFPVYISAIEGGVKMIMVGNVVVSAFDDSCTASLSDKIVTDLLRDEFEFKGVIISGNLSDAAVKDYYGAGEAAVLALKAGCDMVQNPDDFEEAFNAIIDAVNSGVISEERIDDCLRRIYRIKYADIV